MATRNFRRRGTGRRRARTSASTAPSSSDATALFSVDFAEIGVPQATGEWDEAGRVLADAALALERAGAQLLLLCTNTMHEVADAVEAAISIPLLHVGDIAAEASRTAGVRTVGLLGTAFTMEQAFSRERLAEHGLDVVVPGADDRRVVHDIIYAELCRGIVTEPSRQTAPARQPRSGRTIRRSQADHGDFDEAADGGLGRQRGCRGESVKAVRRQLGR